MKGAIILNGYFESPAVDHQVKRLTEEFSSRGVAVDAVRGNAFLYGVKDGKAFADLPPYDFVIFLNKDVYLARILEACGYRLYNTANAISLCDDKILTYLSLAGKGIPFPETLPVPTMYDASEDDAFLSRVEKTLSFPLVAKTAYGSQGKGVRLINSREDLKQTFSKWATVPHLYQRFTGKRGRDVRVIVIKGKAVFSMERVNETDFRSNVECGGVGKPVVLTDEMKRVAEAAATELGLFYAGVDLLYDDEGRVYVCEVNSNAFFKGLERATGESVAGAYAEAVLSDISSRP